jgi:hypothetical protein
MCKECIDLVLLFFFFWRIVRSLLVNSQYCHASDSICNNCDYCESDNCFCNRFCLLISNLRHKSYSQCSLNYHDYPQHYIYFTHCLIVTGCQFVMESFSNRYSFSFKKLSSLLSEAIDGISKIT